MNETIGSCVQGLRDPTAIRRPRGLIRVTLTSNGFSVVDLTEVSDGSILSLSGNSHEGQTIESHPLFGDSDDGHDVAPEHSVVAQAMERFGDYRLCATETPYHDLLPTVLAQRVTAKEALWQWAWLCHTHGMKVEHRGSILYTPPPPDVLQKVPLHEFHLAGIDRRRAETLRNVARHGERLITGWMPDKSTKERTESLRLIPGIGEWTAAVTGHISFGDPDALEVGDFHAKNTVAYALTGRHRGSDEEMCRLLAPYVGHRQRVLQWLRMSGFHAPAHGPRRRNLSIARL